MIVKTLDFADVYRPLSPLIAPALAYLRQPGLADTPNGRYDIPGVSGDDLYAMVQSYDTAPAEARRWEAHRRYVDLQYIISGVELMGYAPRSALRESSPYDDSKDVVFFDHSEIGSLIRLSERMVCILGPEDAHLPGVALGPPVKVRKVVLKVATASFQA